MSEQWHTYICEYPFEGNKWGFEVIARSQEEAEARLKAMVYAKVKGKTVATVRLDRPTIANQLILIAIVVVGVGLYLWFWP